MVIVMINGSKPSPNQFKHGALKLKTAKSVILEGDTTIVTEIPRSIFIEG